MTKQNILLTKQHLLDLLKQEGAYWSYDKGSVTAETVSDERLIADVMRYLDLQEIDMLFKMYSSAKIKKAWLDLLVPEGDYLYSLNRFFAWYYFDIKRPSQYLKSMQTRRINRLFS